MKDNKEYINDGTGFPKLEPGYTVPQRYFDSFGDRLKVRMSGEPLTKQRKAHFNSVLFYLKPALGIAAGLAIFLLVYFHYQDNQTRTMLSAQKSMAVPQDENPTDLLPLPNVFAYLVTENQFFSALTDIDEYDASKISKEVLVDYLASNCSDFEILNANK